MFDLREYKGLFRRLVSEANRNDANWHWSLKALSKTKASIFWSYLEYGDQKPCFTIELDETDDDCMIYAKDEHGYTLNVEMVECKDLLPYDKDGNPGPTLQRIAYENMIVAFEAMGGEWSRKVDGHHRLCLFGVFVETFPDEED